MTGLPPSPNDSTGGKGALARSGSSGHRSLRDRRFRQAATALPNLIMLIARLLRDPRVPARYRAAAMVAVGYVASPVDVIPDFIPLLGQADDILVVAFALHLLMRGAGPEVVAEHWDGDEEVLDVVEGILEWAAGLLPRPMRLLAERWLRPG